MKTDVFKYEGYSIPVNLVNLTGGGTDTWDEISKYHMKMYEKYCPIRPDDTVVEIGSGVGRDAIQIAKVLSKDGKYVGIDIIRESILWCRDNITTMYPNFEFVYLDIDSQIHNPTGNVKTTDISLPIPDNSVDKIVLHSVFTHMFEDDITHYLREFNRILKKDGVVLTSFFLVDEAILAQARKSGTTLTFEHKHPTDPDCLINDKDYPEGAVGFYPKAIKRMLSRSRMELFGPVHVGRWNGREGASNGQDIFILKPSNKLKARAAKFADFKTSLE